MRTDNPAIRRAAYTCTTRSMMPRCEDRRASRRCASGFRWTLQRTWGACRRGHNREVDATFGSGKRKARDYFMVVSVLDPALARGPRADGVRRCQRQHENRARKIFAVVSILRWSTSATCWRARTRLSTTHGVDLDATRPRIDWRPAWRRVTSGSMGRVRTTSACFRRLQAIGQRARRIDRRAARMHAVEERNGHVATTAMSTRSVRARRVTMSAGLSTGTPDTGATTQHRSNA
jgi:hypothetical protein